MRTTIWILIAAVALSTVSAACDTSNKGYVIYDGERYTDFCGKGAYMNTSYSYRCSDTGLTLTSARSANCSEPENCVSGHCATSTCGDSICDDQRGESETLCPQDCGVCDASTLDATRCGPMNRVFLCSTDKFGGFSWKHSDTCSRSCDPPTGTCIDDEVVTCTKSGGKDFYTVGTTIITKVDNSRVILPDMCSDEDTLIEYSCNGRKLLSVSHACTYGCTEGACQQVKQFVCSNSTTSEWHSGACTACPTGFSLRTCEQKRTFFIFKRSREVCQITQNSECTTKPTCPAGWEKIDTIPCSIESDTMVSAEETRDGGNNGATGITTV
jgi:hypothetical protein